MVHPEDRRAQISCSSVFIVHQTVVFLLLTPFCGGQSQIIVALVGGDIILPCHLEPALDAVSMTVEWARPDLNPRFVHVRRDGVELLIDQNPSYIGRTSVSNKQLKCGDISLKLSKVKLSDEGMYRCHIPTQRATSVVTLAVGSVSSPSLRLSKLNDEGSGLQLDCETKGWYPEPEVLWLDGEGNLLSAGPAETVRGPDDLYTVSSRVTVEKRHSNRFTCRVQQKDINQTRETHIHVPDDLFVVPSCSAGRIAIVLVVGFMCILAVILAALFMGRKINESKMPYDDKTELGKQEKTKQNNSGHQTVCQGESSQLLKREKEKLDEELEKNEEDLKKALEVLDKLKKHKMALKNHKEEVSLILNELTDKTMTRAEDKKSKQERRTLTRMKILEEAGNLIETTEEMVITMTEMKTRLEKDKEQVHKQLKEKLKDEQSDSEELN